MSDDPKHKPDAQEHRKGKFEYKKRQIDYREEDDGLVLTIDGTPFPPIARIDGQYHTEFFPFRGFPTIKALAETLVDTEGKLWVLSQEGKERPS